MDNILVLRELIEHYGKIKSDEARMCEARLLEALDWARKV